MLQYTPAHSWDLAVQVLAQFPGAMTGAGIDEERIRAAAHGLGLGDRVDDILAVNAAPGFSEHHGGRALDIGAPGEPPAEENFEQTPAFEWLQANAGNHCFTMSYPRDNPHGIIHEPWHWCYQPA